MDELGTLSPASRERSLDELPRKELQQLAKEAGVKGNIKSKDIVQSLLRCLEGEAAVPGTIKKAQPATSVLALARADTNDSVGGDSSDFTGNRTLHASLDEALAHTSDSQQLTAPGRLSAKNCVSNPLYEEPDPLRPVPIAAADSALSHETAKRESNGSALQLKASSAGGMQESQNKQDAGWLEPAEACAEQHPENMERDSAHPKEVSDVSLAAAAIADAQPKDHHPDPMYQDTDMLPANEGTSATMQFSDPDPETQPTGPQSVHPVRAPQAEEEQRRREATPEELANLGKAVDMVQARSCQLSPSLLTVGQNPDGMDSPARDAFERGRKSGIWQGSTEVELRQLERQWDDHKVQSAA
ncbi:hypothetical protein WJX79_000429 [Trebouxia sp. C0005]